MAVIKEVKGERVASRKNVEVLKGFPHNFYIATEEKLPADEQKLADLLVKAILRKVSFDELAKNLPQRIGKFVEDFRNDVIQLVEVNELIEKLPTTRQWIEVKEALLKVLKEPFKIKDREKFVKYVLNHSIGYRDIHILIDDEELEEVMLNGFNRNVFVFDRRFGMCKTNIKIPEDGFLYDLIKRIARTSGREINEAHPMIDARLPNKHRANATYSYVTPFGHSLTIRKFTKIPLSVVDLIANQTLTSEMAAFLWVMVEGMGIEPMNVIVTGGAGNGKTTLLDVLNTFVRYSERILTIEDTLELNLGGRENWIQMESKPRIGEMKPVTMNDLLINALRMRPDRVIVGEVRGEEAQTLFVAMDIGHRGIMGTLHSNSAREMLLRLKSAPMSVPEMMLPLINLIVVMQKHFEEGKGIVRRIKHIAEVSRMEEKVLLSNIYEYDRKKDEAKRTDVPSHVMEVLSERTAMTKNELKKEILVREKILEWLLDKDVRDSTEVESIIQKYYLDPSLVLERVSADFKKKVEEEERAKAERRR